MDVPDPSTPPKPEKALTWDFRQIQSPVKPAHGTRQWFQSGDATHLTVFEQEHQITGIDLVYPKDTQQFLLRWRQQSPIWHGAIESSVSGNIQSELRPGKIKGSVLLEKQSPMDKSFLYDKISLASGLPNHIQNFILTKLLSQPDSSGR